MSRFDKTSYGNILNILKGEKLLKYDKEITGSVIAATYAHATFLERIELKRTPPSLCYKNKPDVHLNFW